MNKTELLSANLQGKVRTVNDARMWLSSHQIEFDRFLEDTFTHESQADAFRRFFIEDPFLGVQKTINHCLDNGIKIEILKELLSRLKFGQCLFIGQQQSGKTALMFILAEWLSNMGKNVAWLGAPAKLPSFIKIATADYYEIPENCVIILDEGAVRFSQRNSMTSESKEFFSNIPIISHKDQILFLSAQSLALTDVYSTHLFIAMFIKSMTQPQILAERSIVKEIREWIPFTNDKTVTYVRWVIHPALNFTVRIQLPNWWDSELSKPYSILNQVDAEAYARQLWEKWSGQPDVIKRITQELKRKGHNKSQLEWKKFFGV